jgi:hypothetical protein
MKKMIQISVESLIAERPQPSTAGGHHVRLRDEARPATVQLNKICHFDRVSCGARNMSCKDLGKIAPRLRRSKEHAITEAEQIADELDELTEVKHAISVSIVQRQHGHEFLHAHGRRGGRCWRRPPTTPPTKLREPSQLVGKAESVAFGASPQLGLVSSG